MSDPYVRALGVVTDIDGRKLGVGVDYDSVVIGPDGFRLNLLQAEEFARLFVSACWDAGVNAERMRQEAAVSP